MSAREHHRGKASRPPLHPDAIPPALQQAWLRELRRSYDLCNLNFLKDRLRPPLFRLGESAGKLGTWHQASRTITISARHILEHPWERVLDTLRHEMAHQYVQEYLGLDGTAPHGAAFAEACRLLRADSSGAARNERLGKLEGSDDPRDRILARVKLLLALAKSPNEHEAANAMRMANRYLLEYNLDLAQADSKREYGVRHLGRCSGRIQEYEYALAHILQDHFFVCVIWTFSYDAAANRRGRVLQISGTPENLEMAEYVHHYVMNLTEHLWERHRKSTDHRGGTRLQYLAGVVRGLQEKLDRQKAELKQELGLVWLGDPGLREFYRYHHPYIRRTSTWGVSRGERYRAGLKDGRQITIHRGVEERSGGGRRLLLPGGGPQGG